MKRLTIPAALAAILGLAGAAVADPYCSALADPDQVPKKYAKRAPFHVDPPSGWLVGEDQLKTEFDVTEETSALWNALVEGFDTKGVKLVVLAAPPRPLFAPQNALPGTYNAIAAQEAFSSYIAAMNTSGIPAPDLSVVRDTSHAAGFYFARDTHWTPAGAAIAAAHLSAAVTGQPAADTIANVSFDETYTEKGSLSTVVEATCGTRPETELVSAPVFATQGDATTLLSVQDDASVALIGTSFSDRYQRDAYQVASALTHALDQPVDNFSVTGGGMTGAMEAFLRSEAFSSGQYDTVIWETPYTAPLTNISGLRQILGILQENGEATHVYTGSVGSDWMNVDHGFSIENFAALHLKTPSVTKGKLGVELYDANGQKIRTNLVKSDRVTAEARSDTWSLSLAALPIKDVKRFKIRLAKEANDITIHLIK